ncbi:hypothetical protein [uncultured Sphaerochaeta sp.]|uniref:hypothetical protein n=1 Tax=uncultured Sphaerochaeta sp. TaxID=886478 RepID=UPI002A0A3307|nr:hypothetical protein [uncultured Sphaerochaeta sp.]
MKSKVRILLSSLCLVVLAISLSVFVVPLFFPRVAVFLDAQYADTQWKQTSQETKKLFLRAGYTTKVFIVDPLPLDDDLLSQVFSDKKTKMVLFSPLLTALEKKENFQEGPARPFVVGMGPLGLENVFFDVVLTADDDAGWSDAALFLKEEQRKHHLPTALLFQQGDERSEASAKSFEASFPDASLQVLEQTEETTGKAYAQSVLKKMQNQKILQVAAPGVHQLEDYFGSDTTLQWVVDVRYLMLVPYSQQLAVVADDLSLSVKPLLPLLKARAEKRETPLPLPLLRTCYPRTKTLGNWFESVLQALRHSLL